MRKGFLIRAAASIIDSILLAVIYTAILWSAFYGYYFWGEVPSSEAIFGGSLVIFSGLYLIYWEKRQAQLAQEESNL